MNPFISEICYCMNKGQADVWTLSTPPHPDREQGRTPHPTPTGQAREKLPIPSFTAHVILNTLHKIWGPALDSGSHMVTLGTIFFEYVEKEMTVLLHLQ